MVGSRNQPVNGSGIEVVESIWLDQLVMGRCATVSGVQAAPEDAQRLKAMGVCAGREVMLIKSGDPLILRVLGTRIGISGRLAATVQVVPCLEPRCTPDANRDECDPR